MGLTKQYLAYRPCGIFNIIASGRSNINFAVHDKIEGRYCLVGAAENAVLWDLKLGSKCFQLQREKSEVTSLRISPDHYHVAIGYIDGVIQIFELSTQSVVCSLSIHKRAVNILRYDKVGMRLITGGADTELVVIDVVSLVGKYRLIGHNAPVTDAHFSTNLESVAISGSKDTQIKFWNLETQTCFKTLVDNRTEVWNLSYTGQFLFSGCGESTINVYKITDLNTEKEVNSVIPSIEGLSIDDENLNSPINVVNCGIIQRAGKGRTVNLISDPTNKILAVSGTNDVVELFYICSEEEALTRLNKRLNKIKKKTDIESSTKEISLSDEIKRLSSIKVGNKIKSIDIVLGQNEELRILISLANNSLKLYSLNLTKKNSEAMMLRTIAQCGHQSEVRTVNFSSDSHLILSGSGESAKLWTRESMQCVKTITTEYVLSSTFVPGDKHILLGLKSGNLLIVDITVGEILEEIPAHKSELWCICLLPDLKGCVTGSSDKTAKIWSFELIENENNHNLAGKVLSLLHKNTLVLEESVLCVKVSPNSKFVAIGLLDSTVKIFFLDSHKFYLSLYGHKLPVLCMDISYDSSLIATGSADRNIKIWGLDFGDCHRSLFAHDDSVMGLQFIPKTHMIFTCGKDGKIKQWDGDTFDKITTLNGHIGEAYSLAISPDGLFLITCGSDRTLRIFERTDEPIVLSDIQEEEREEIENRQLATGEDNNVPLLPGLKMPSRKTVGSEKAAESILECLDICKNYEGEDIKLVELHPLMKAYGTSNPNDFLISVFQRIQSSDLEEALLLLPFSNVIEILKKIPVLSENRRDQAELILKITLFLFRVHQKPITSNHTLSGTITNIINILEKLAQELRDMIGVNYYSLQFLQREVEEREGVELFRDATKSKKQRDKKTKKRLLLKRVHI